MRNRVLLSLGARNKQTMLPQAGTRLPPGMVRGTSKPVLLRAEDKVPYL